MTKKHFSFIALSKNNLERFTASKYITARVTVKLQEKGELVKKKKTSKKRKGNNKTTVHNKTLEVPI